MKKLIVAFALIAGFNLSAAAFDFAGFRAAIAGNKWDEVAKFITEASDQGIDDATLRANGLEIKASTDGEGVCARVVGSGNLHQGKESCGINTAN